MITSENLKETLLSQLNQALETFNISFNQLKNVKRYLKGVDIPEEIFSEFFNYLLSYETFKEELTSKDISFLKKKQKEYLDFLLNLNIGEDYLKNRLRIFQKHYQQKVPLEDFIASYSKILADIFEYLISQKKEEAVPTLLKLSFLDVFIAVKVYLSNEEKKFEKLKKRYTELFNEINDGIIVINVDKNEIVEINKRIEDWLGVEKKEILNRDISFLFLEEAKIKRLLKERFERYPVLYLKNKKGTLLPVELSLSFSLNNGQLFAFAIVRNIKYRLEIEKQIDRLSRLYKVLSETNQLITQVKRVDELFKKIVEILVKTGNFDCAMVVPVNRDFKPIYFSCIRKETSETFLKKHLSFIYEAIEKKEIVRKVTEEGEKIFVPIFKRNNNLIDNGICRGVLVVSSEEVSFFKDEELQLLKEVSSDLSFAVFSIERNKKIQFLEYFDVITKLPNRKFFFNTLEKLTRKKTNFTLIVLDIVHFKEINETFSFVAGDTVLKIISEKLQKFFEKSKLIARVGGDEFGIIVEDGEKEEVLSYVKEVLSKIRQEPIKIEGQNIFIAFNAGVSFYPDDGDTAEELIAAAEAALKEAKKIGKNVCEFYNPLLKKEHLQELELENDLRNAILNEEFRLFYQPIYSLKENKIVGAEALIRWFSPKRGYVPPLHFIKVLEDSGLIHDVGMFVIDTVLKQIKKWHKFGIYISMNISPYQIKAGYLSSLLKEKIQTYSVDPEKIVIELTETVIMENLEQALQELKKLENMKINMAIDDFGTGYSSLSYLKNLPFSSVKIDRSFVMDIPKDKNDIKISKAIINLAHSLDKSVIAEGIETEEQLYILKELDCDFAQGYFFSKPIPEEEFEKLLK